MMEEIAKGLGKDVQIAGTTFTGTFGMPRDTYTVKGVLYSILGPDLLGLTVAV